MSKPSPHTSQQPTETPRPVVRPEVVEALAQRIAALLEPRICMALEDIANDFKADK